MDNASFNGRDSTFATRLRSCMAGSKTTQDKLAKVTGITRQAIAQYCDGSVIPNIEKLYLFAEYFNVSTDYLVGNTGVSKPNETIQAIHKYTGLSESSIERLHKHTNNVHLFFAKGNDIQALQTTMDNKDTEIEKRKDSKVKVLSINNFVKTIDTLIGEYGIVDDISKFLFSKFLNKDNSSLCDDDNIEEAYLSIKESGVDIAIDIEASELSAIYLVKSQSKLLALKDELDKK